MAGATRWCSYLAPAGKPVPQTWVGGVCGVPCAAALTRWALRWPPSLCSSSAAVPWCRGLRRVSAPAAGGRRLGVWAGRRRLRRPPLLLAAAAARGNLI